MRPAEGRYTFKVRHGDGTIGYSLIEIPGDYPDLESALKSYIGKRGITPIGVEPHNFPWDPAPKQNQIDYATTANKVLTEGGLTEDNLSRIGQLQAPGVMPQVTPQSKELTQQVQPIASSDERIPSPKRYYKSTWAKNDPNEPDHLHGSGAFDVDHELTPDEIADYRRRGIDVTPIDQATAGQMNAAYRQRIDTPSPIIDRSTPVAQPRTLDSAASYTTNPLHNAVSQIAGIPSLPPGVSTALQARVGNDIGEVVDGQEQPVDPGRNSPNERRPVEVRTPDGQIHNHIGITPELDAQLRAGGQINYGGQWVTPEEFMGGFVIKGTDNRYLTLGPLFGQNMTQEQADALNAAGKTPAYYNYPTPTTGGPDPRTPSPVGTRPPPGTLPTDGGAIEPLPTGGLPNPAANMPYGPTLPSGAEEMFKALAGFTARKTAGLDNLFSQQGEWLNFVKEQFKNNANARDGMVSRLLDGGEGAPGAMHYLTDALARRNEATGLSPQALSALRTNATSNLNAGFQSAAQAARSDLIRRGAYGGGKMPGSEGDIIRSMTPLYGALETARGQANRDVILADEQARIQSLLGNRQAAENASNMMMGGIGQFGQIYNPTPYLGAAENTVGNMTNLYTAPTAWSGQAINAAGGLADMEPGSFKNILLTSLLSSLGPNGQGGSGLMDWINMGRDIYNQIIRSRSNPTAPTNPTTPGTPTNTNSGNYPGFVEWDATDPNKNMKLGKDKMFTTQPYFGGNL